MQVQARAHHDTARSWTIAPRSASTLLVRFVGPTLTHEIPPLLDALTRRLPERSARLVFDIRDLEGHNSEVRLAFQRWLTAHRERIESITVVVRRAAAAFKVAASVVRIATGLNIQIRDDLESDASVTHLVR